MREITFIFNFDYFRIGRLVAGIVLICAVCCCDTLAGENSTHLDCQPAALYRGEMLTVTLPSKHGAEFGILNGQGNLMMIAFQPRARDTIPPVIAPEAFQSMDRVLLSTKDAKGSLARPYSAGRNARVKTVPAPIFTRSGDYEVLLSTALGTEDAEVRSCWVNYIHAARPGTAEK